MRLVSLLPEHSAGERGRGEGFLLPSLTVIQRGPLSYAKRVTLPVCLVPFALSLCERVEFVNERDRIYKFGRG